MNNFSLYVFLRYPSAVLHKPLSTVRSSSVTQNTSSAEMLHTRVIYKITVLQLLNIVRILSHNVFTKYATQWSVHYSVHDALQNVSEFNLSMCNTLQHIYKLFHTVVIDDLDLCSVGCYSNNTIASGYLIRDLQYQMKYLKRLSNEIIINSNRGIHGRLSC